jgi:glycine/D-amino acid oxidase-like deaminating enzyme
MLVVPPTSPVADRSVAGAKRSPYWLDRADRPAAADVLSGSLRADLVVVGAGFTGLWTAVLAKERDPSRSVTVVEGGRVAWAASGRNGGFCSASLTHGLSNGVSRFPDEIGTLLRLGDQNLAEIEAAIDRHGIDCGWENHGNLVVATRGWQVAELARLADLSTRHGLAATLLDESAVRAALDSPTYRAGLLLRDDGGLVDPARLAWGLAAAARSLGVRFFEHSPVSGVFDEGARVVVSTRGGTVSGRAVVLATNAFRPLLRRHRLSVVPVYNYALMTDPLTDEQLGRIGWAGRQGVSDAGAELFYYRLSQDNRILWGGPHTDYFYGGRIATRFEQRPDLFRQLAREFFTTFPQLEDVTFSHAWGGVIDISSRAVNFWDVAMGGKLASSLGFSGLGVGSSRFAGEVLLDLLDGTPTERTELRLVRERPVRFPPEPVRSVGVALTKRAIRSVDRHRGRRNAWLRMLDRLGVGFDG